MYTLNEYKRAYIIIEMKWVQQYHETPQSNASLKIVQNISTNTGEFFFCPLYYK